MNDDFTPPSSNTTTEPETIVDIEMIEIKLDDDNVEGVLGSQMIDATPDDLIVDRKFPYILIAPDTIDDKSKNTWLYYPIFTIVVSIIDIALMIWVLAIGGFAAPSTNAMLGPPAQTLLYAGGKWTPYILEQNQWWRLISASYLHAGIIHLITNLVLQISLGWILEKKYGTIKLAIIYVVSGIGGILTSAIFIPDMLTVGASGALMGMIAMWVVDVFSNFKMLEHPWITVIFILGSLIVTFGLGLLPYVDNFAHIGGFIFGLELSIIFLPTFKSVIVWKKRLRWILFFVFIALFLLNFIGFFVLLYTVDLKTFCPNCRYVNCIPYIRDGVDWCVSGI